MSSESTRNSPRRKTACVMIDKAIVHPYLLQKRFVKPKMRTIVDSLEGLSRDSLEGFHVQVFEKLSKTNCSKQIQIIKEWYDKKSRICESCQKFINGANARQCKICDDYYHQACVLDKPIKKYICDRCSTKQHEIDQLNLIDVKCQKCDTVIEEDECNECMRCKATFHDDCFIEADLPLCNACSDIPILLSDQNKIEALMKKYTVIKGHNFIFPQFCKDKVTRTQCVDSVFIALQNQNLRFNDDLQYHSKSRTANNPQFEPYLQTMHPDDIALLKQFKNYSRYGLYAPMRVDWIESQGYVVRAMDMIPMNTILCEYSGSVYSYADQVFSQNDSIMTLLQTSRSTTTLVIVPQESANIAKYLSGINNHKHKRTNKQNVVSKRYNVEGEARVILIAMRNISDGEILYYDYNEGGLNAYDTRQFE